MRCGWSGFRGSLLFAAAAALAWVPFALVLGPWLPGGAALGAYALLSVGIYAAGLANTARRAVAVGLFAGATGIAVLLAGPSLREAVAVAALLLAVCRSAFLFRARPARIWAAEALLLLGGLGLARVLLGPGLISGALAVWGFYLVQSVYFLLGGVKERRSASADVDPFEAARSRATALMEDQSI